MRAEPLRHWLPAIVWAAVILGLSGEGGSAGNTDRWLTAIFGDLGPDARFYINYAVRKAAHVVGYGILGALNLRAIRRGRPEWRLSWSVAAVALAGLVAVVDELHQSTSTVRTGSAADIGFDLCGAALAQVVFRRRATPRVPSPPPQRRRRWP